MTAPATRRTKIVITLGPALESPEVLRAALAAGADVVRINLSHTDLPALGRWLDRVEAASAALGRPVGVMLDTAGPEVRVRAVTPQNPLPLGEGARLAVVEPGVQPPAEPAVTVDWPGLLAAVRPGSGLEFGDGALGLTTLEAGAGWVAGQVHRGGTVSLGQKISRVGAPWPLPILSPHDLEAFRAAGTRIDFVAVSLVRGPEDLSAARAALAGLGLQPWLVAKIETRAAVDALDAILPRADAVMVARGDLGVECSPLEVPELQKAIIFAAARRGVPVVTATQMLESMVHRPEPTRAETTDVANAIWDGSDAVMLSEETALGAYPVEAVRVLAELAARADQAIQYRHEPGLNPESVGAAVAWAAAALSRTLPLAAILTATESGTTARWVSRFRPRPPVVGLSPHLATRRRLTLLWGVIPWPMAPAKTSDDMMKEAVAAAVQGGVLAPGDRYLLTAGVPFGTPGTTNLLRIESVPEARDDV
ncbi:MAG: pyruvate kinase [Firmicutes bacterium]|nr:pyruvate kinase [Alicyclobacillaceae bacterium]MCL6496480.1 pyruvate kinase [Bacillota bacterium]